MEINRVKNIHLHKITTKQLAEQILNSFWWFNFEQIFLKSDVTYLFKFVMTEKTHHIGNIFLKLVIKYLLPMYTA